MTGLDRVLLFVGVFVWTTVLAPLARGNITWGWPI